MSVRPYGEYKIGTIGLEGPEKWSDLFDVIFDIVRGTPSPGQGTRYLIMN
jgi:hypothetical protein